MMYMLYVDTDIAYIKEPFGANLTLDKLDALDVIHKLLEFYMTVDNDELNNIIVEEKNNYENQFQSTSSKRIPAKNIQGFIYVFEASDNSYKIGFSKNVKRRLNELSSMHSYPLKLIIEKDFDNVVKVEQFLHKKYVNNRLNGEWFRFTKEELSDVIDTIEHLDRRYLCNE